MWCNLLYRKHVRRAHMILVQVGDKLLLDAADPRIATPKPNGAIPLTILSIFPYGTVEVIHPKFGTFKSLNTGFPEPHGQAHGCVVGRARTMGGNTVMRYDSVKTEKECFPNTGFDNLPRLCAMAMGNPAKLKRACDTPLPTDRGRACQNNKGVRLHTRAWEKRTKDDTAVQHHRVHQCAQFRKPRNTRAGTRTHGRASRPCAPISL
ncbi:hypothetical protein GOBAR_AA17464 [Gossypium barbadense]|uniref:Uncharacterized protein n=1 Tax=Gossypium barbadense TaxID=3634 RepID=A0A2P5XIL4_GOSBA|nr:hypothetical protein GOBAR_AA17464 [Gossypium barbadense]